MAVVIPTIFPRMRVHLIAVGFDSFIESKTVFGKQDILKCCTPFFHSRALHSEFEQLRQTFNIGVELR